MASDLAGESALSVDEDLILHNVERMLETVLDELDVLLARPAGALPQQVGGDVFGPGEIMACPVCQQLVRFEQLRKGRCFVCDALLSSVPGV